MVLDADLSSIFSTQYVVLPLTATRFAACTEGILVTFKEASLF